MSTSLRIFPRSLITLASMVGVVFLCDMSVPQYAQAFNLSVAIASQSTGVMPGDRVYFEVDIKYPENTRRQDLRVTYQILDEEKVIADEQVLRAVETQTSFLDYITVPQTADSDAKHLNVIIESYESKDQGGFKYESSASFNVLRSSEQKLIYLFVTIGAGAFVALLVVVQLLFVLLHRKSGHL